MLEHCARKTCESADVHKSLSLHKKHWHRSTEYSIALAHAPTHTPTPLANVRTHVLTRADTGTRTRPRARSESSSCSHHVPLSLDTKTDAGRTRTRKGTLTGPNTDTHNTHRHTHTRVQKPFHAPKSGNTLQRQWCHAQQSGRGNWGQFVLVSCRVEFCLSARDLLGLLAQCCVSLNFSSPAIQITCADVCRCNLT